MNFVNDKIDRYQEAIISFTQELIRIKSYSGQEESIIKFIRNKMVELGFDEVRIDGMGNVLGRIGSGEAIIMFDSHVDTVEVNDESEWEYPPFQGVVSDGHIHGRGSVDMKSSVAASIYAAVIAREEGYTTGKTVYVSCTVMEEDCDGENLKHLFAEFDLKPDYMIICEPSNNKIALGHKGKAQIAISTQGISAHGAAPEQGVNAVYEMAEIIQRVEKRNEELSRQPGLKGSLVLSRISSVSASLNAVPSECEIYLDRRTVPGETNESISREMDDLIQGINASWKVGNLLRKSWTGKEVDYQPFHEAWRIDQNHELTKACIAVYEDLFDVKDVDFEFWNFSTNAVTPVALGIPTIGFGPGDYHLAHMRDEQCEVKQIIEACAFYAKLIGEI